MRRILGTIGAMLAIVAAMAALALPAVALVGYLTFSADTTARVMSCRPSSAT